VSDELLDVFAREHRRHDDLRRRLKRS
jgi:hypothetical protein